MAFPQLVACLLVVSLSFCAGQISFPNPCTYASTLASAVQGACPTLSYTTDLAPYADATSPVVPPSTPSPYLLLDRPTHVYAVYYGTFDAATVKATNNFLSSLTGMQWQGALKNSMLQWYATTAEYVGTDGKAPPVFLHPVMHSKYAAGTSLDAGAIETLLISLTKGRAINRQLASELVLFIASSDVSIAGVCTDTCSYSSQYSFPLKNYPSNTIPYIVVADPSASCPSKCSVYGQGSGLTPPNSLAIDSIVYLLSRHIPAMVTNPDGFGFQDQNGNDIGAKCSWSKGENLVGKTPSGGSYNTYGLNGYYYYVQPLWSNKKNICTLFEQYIE